MSGLILHGIEFRTEELPEKINFGGEQTVAVRKFPGGGLDVQALGAFDDPIRWEGNFMYTDALTRCRAIDALRVKGEPVILEVGSISRKVLITKFVYHYWNDFLINYQLEVQPVICYGPSSATINGQNSQAAGSSSANIQPGAASAQLQPQITYVVKTGDTLWKIARQFYQNPAKWPRIARDNQLKNPNRLEPGMKLFINNPVTKVE